MIELNDCIKKVSELDFKMKEIESIIDKFIKDSLIYPLHSKRYEGFKEGKIFFYNGKNGSCFIDEKNYRIADIGTITDPDILLLFKLKVKELLNKYDILSFMDVHVKSVAENSKYKKYGVYFYIEIDGFKDSNKEQLKKSREEDLNVMINQLKYLEDYYN